MDSTYSALLEKTRLPQPSFQRFAVVSLFRRLESSGGALGPNSSVCHDAISQCLRSSFAAVVDQAVHELCRLVSVGDRLSTTVALIELQSALEGCEKRFAPVFVKGIGFLCRFAFCIDSSWGRRFERVELHPFVKVLSCCEESHAELIEQVMLFIVRNKVLGINEVVRFLRPFIMFSMIWKSSSACVYFFSRNLISAIASLSCSFPLEAICILKLLTDCLKYLPSTNEEEFLYIVASAVHIVDAFVVVLQRTVDIEKDVARDAQRCSVEVLCMLLSICASFYRKPLVQVEPVIEISKHLLVAQKELGLCYAFEFVNIIVSASVILAQVEFEHDQLSVLKLLILLLEWKTEELSTKRASCSLGEEVLIVFPVINLLSSPSKPVKAAVTHLLSLAESFVLNFMSVLKKTEVSFTNCPILTEAETIPLRLLHHLFTQGQQLPSSSYFFLFTSDKITFDNEKYSGPLHWTSWLREHLLIIEREKATFPPQSSENHYEGVNILLCSIAYSLVISPAVDTSAVDLLVALGVQNSKLGMAMFQAVLFYINILFKFESDSSKILLILLEMLPSLASNSAMVQIIVQTILPMLHKDAKLSLHAVAIRLLCKTWVVSDRVFEHLQGVLSPNTLSNFESVWEICVSVAASVREVCKHNPDRGVDLILSVSSCIESEDSTVKALGLHSLSSLCEADVVDFYTAWEVVAKHVNTYTEEPVVAAGLVTLLRWGALDVETYPDIARIILLILWEVGTSSYSSEYLWVKARRFAFQSMMHYEIVKFQEIIPEFKEKMLQCLLNEYNAEVLEAMEEFEIKIINFEHIIRRRALKERRPLGYKVAKLLDAFPQALFSAGTGNLIVNTREFPGAALLSYVFNPKQLHGLTNDVPRIHASYEKALIEIAESLPLSRNILIALLALESWKAFIEQWIKALVTSSDAKGSSSELDNKLKGAGDILKICRKVAEETIPQVSINATLAIGALCLVVPSSSYAVISAASNFLLKWLVDYEHEHHQWSSAISLGLISNCFHATDRMLKMNVIEVLIQEACNSKSHLVIGACGLGLGFACQGLLSSPEVDSNRLSERNLLCDVIKTLSMVLSKLCPLASDSLKNLIESFLLDGYDSAEASSVLPQCKLDSLVEEEPWGVAGLVLGLGNCAFAMYRLGLNDPVLILKDILLSWVPSFESSNKSSLYSNEMTNISLAVGACLAIPIVVAFCQNVELMVGDIGAILIRYVSLVSELLNSSVSGIHYQNLVMASCVGAGSFISCILNDGVHSIRYDDIKHLLEFLRNGYSNSHPPLVRLGAMIGVVNAFGAAAGDLTYKHIQASFLPISLELTVSDFVRGPIILSPICENLSTSFVQELFLLAKDAGDQQTRKYAAWAVSFLRYKWCSEKVQEIDCSKGISLISALQSQSFADDNLVWKMCSWLSSINYHQMHSNTVVAVLRCISKAPKLPVLDWASIIRGFMKNAANFPNKSQILQDATSFQEECIDFSLAHAKDVKSLLLFLDDLVDPTRFRTLELKLQCLLLRHVSDLMNTFSASRIERLFQDFAHFFSSSASPYLVYGLKQKFLLRIAFWKGLYQCLNGAYLQSSCVSEIEKCMECLFGFMPTFAYNVKTEELLWTCSEWCEAIRCLTKARHGWLISVLQFSDRSTLNEIAIRILAKVRLVKNGSFSFSELERLKSFILNFRLEGVWWSVLLELVSTLSSAQVSIKRQWLLDALDVSCVTENPSTAISFVGLLSGSCSKYMPLLIVEPEIVLRDLSITLPSLLSSSSWSAIAESSVDKLWQSTERICTWAVMLSSGAIDDLPNSNRINESNVDASVSLARLMHQTCLSLKDYLPVDRQLRLANLEVP